MKLIHSFTTILVVAFLFTPQASKKVHHSSDYHHNAEYNHGWVMDDLNLTEKQREELRNMHRKNIESRREHWIKVKDLRNKIKDEIASDKPNMNKLKDYAVEMSNLIAESTQRRIDELMELKKVLNKDQFQKILNHEWRGKGGEGYYKGRHYHDGYHGEYHNGEHH